MSVSPSDTRPRRKTAYSSHRRRSVKYEVKHLPPPWKRSLTESGMQRRIERMDIVAVVLFIMAVLAALAWILASGAR